MVLAVLCPLATLQRKQLLTSEERPQQRAKLSIPAQSCNCLTTQKTHESSKVPRTTRTSKRWFVVVRFPDIHDSAKCSSSLSTASRILVQPSWKPLCAYKPSKFCNFTIVYNEHKLLYSVQMSVRQKWHISTHLPCTDPNLDEQHTSIKLTYGA